MTRIPPTIQAWRKSLTALTRVVALLGALLVALFLPTIARADNVAQIMTTKYFAPETVTMLKNRALGGGPYGLQSGDIVSYIIEFTPAANGSDDGAMGYITDYIPAGTEVVGASIVQPDGSGGFVDVAPTLPGLTPDSAGKRGISTYFSPFTGSYDAACVGVYLPDDCNGRIAQIYADTGIFYSTDSRTALYVGPDTSGIIEQGTNGYLIGPTQGDKLNPIVGNPITNTATAKFFATTHNLWDASNTNAFGSKDAIVDVLPSPKSSQTTLIDTNEGTGATPFNSGSAVAGPDAGYKLDYTGAVGPWQRIQYAGSRIGSNADGPSHSVDETGTVVGSFTNAGYALSSSNPLPSNTNAVRWAVGGLTVGQIRYVKLSLRLTATPSSAGLINNCEVFGGDTATNDDTNKDGKDNTWRYHVPSVCTTNSNLYILKQVVKYTSGGTTTTSDGAIVPVNAKLTYRITYLNTSAATQTNVLLSDVLPSFTTGNCLSNVTVISGPISAVYTPSTNPCNSPRTVTFNNGVGVSLAAGAGGAIELDVQLSGTAADDIITNQAKICSTQTPNCTSSNAISTVGSRSNLTIKKTASPASVSPGGAVAYTVTIKNNGTAAATSIVVTDVLPGSTDTPCATATRFNYVNASSSVSGLTAVNPGSACAPSVTGMTTLNREQLTWTFTGQSLAVGASFTITFNASVGTSVPTSTSPYVNYVQVVYNAGTASTTANTYVVAPTSAGLLSFDLRTGKKGVNVKWETGAELNIIGFNVWRKNGKREWKKLNAELIDAKEIGNPNGAKYNYLDGTAKATRKYRYKLEIITTGASEWSGVVKNK